MDAGDLPLVGIVVVNFYGDDRTLGCLGSLERLTWPAERVLIALVDNGSAPGFADRVRSEHPQVRIVVTGRNVGFGQACNFGFQRLEECDYLALLNNDATPDPGWLEPLVEVLDADPTVGAATPKVLLDGRFLTVEVRSRTTHPGRGDPRSLGVQLCGARVDGIDVSDGVELVDGFWGWEHDATTVGGEFAWTDGRGIAHVRVPAANHRSAVALDLRLGCGTGQSTSEVISGEVVARIGVGVHPAWVPVGAGLTPSDIVNNAGIVLRRDGSAADRGYLEPDDGRYDEPSDVFGWSGAAVLLSRRYLDDVGEFDGRFFLYYEDVDLSWRGRLRGWTYRCEPRSIVRHERSATVGSRSGIARHLADRNRLVMLTKCAPLGFALRAVSAECREFVRTVQRDVVRRAVTGGRPVTTHVARRARGLAAYARLLPHALRERRVIQRRANQGVDVLRYVERSGGEGVRIVHRRHR